MTKVTKEMEEIIDTVIDNKEMKIPKEEKTKFKKLFVDILVNDKSPAEAMGFGKEMTESIYGHSYRLYQAGKYNEAIDMFRFLLLLDFSDPRFSLGLGASYHRIGEYEKAADNYMLSHAADPKSPIALFYASDCYLKEGKTGYAFISLEWASQVCGDQEKYAKLKDKITLSIENVANKLTEECKNVKLKLTPVEMRFKF